MGGGVNSLNSPKLKPILAFAAIFSFFSITLQAQTDTKTLKLFTPPSGLSDDSILLWHRDDSTVRIISSAIMSTAIEPWQVATTSNKASSNTQNIYQNGRVGIGNFNTTTPATALDIENGTTNGAIKIVDGTQGAGKILISDANGVGTWRTTGVATAGTVPSVSTGTLTTSSYSYTGYNISVPPGNSVVSCGFLLANASTTLDGYATFALSTSSTSNVRTGITTTPNLAAMSIVPLLSGQTTVRSSGQILFNVNNTTGANVTVYVWGLLASANGSGTVTIGGNASFAEPFIFVQQ